MSIMFHDADRTSAIHTLAELTAFLKTDFTRPEMLTDQDYDCLSDIDRDVYDRARMLYASGGIVLATPHVQEASRLLTQAFAVNVGRNSGHVGLLLDGDSTVGKTETTKTLMRTVYSQYKRFFPDFENHNRIPIVYISVPASSTAKLLIKAFAEFFGLPVISRESMGDMRVRVVKALIAAGTQLIVVDELQNLVGRSLGLGESVDILKNLHNEVPATFVYAGFQLADSTLLAGTKGQQLRGRFTILTMDRLNLSDPADRKTWAGLIAGFEKKLPLRHQVLGTLKEHRDYLYMRTSGSIGSLAKLLTASAAELINNPAHTIERLTEAVMDTVTLDIYAEENYSILKNRQTKGTKSAMHSMAELISA